MAGWKKKRVVMQRYDVTAHIYDMQYAEEQVLKIQAALRNLKIRSQDRVLDVGCGTGVLFEHVGDEAEEIVGIDISRETLLRAKIRAKRFRNISLSRADADNLPFRSEVFHKVFAVTLLQNMPSPKKTLNEIKRVTTETGSIVITGLKKFFNKRKFEKLLVNVTLKARVLDEEDLKCFVAVCVKTRLNRS